MRWAALLLGQSFLVLSRILVDKKSRLICPRAE
jgi:hypothetical protein